MTYFADELMKNNKKLNKGIEFVKNEKHEYNHDETDTIEDYYRDR